MARDRSFGLPDQGGAGVPVRPTDNADIEALDGGLPCGCLNAGIFGFWDAWKGVKTRHGGQAGAEATRLTKA